MNSHLDDIEAGQRASTCHISPEHTGYPEPVEPGTDGDRAGEECAASSFNPAGDRLPAMGFIQRAAEGIDGMTRSVWDESSTGMKAVVLVVLIVTGAALPLIPIAWIARWIAN
jgi:hypothetical protein